MPTPSEAIAILRRALPGLLPASADDAGGDASGDAPAGLEYGDPTGSLALRELRGSREGELQTRLANDQFGAGSSRPDPNTGRDAALLRFLQGDIAADPYTGTAARARTQHVQDALDTASTTMRPEVGDAADTVARRNAFAKFLTVGAEARAKNEEETSPAGRLSADLASGRKIQEVRAAHPDPAAAFTGGGAGGAGAGGGGGDASNVVEYWTQQALNDPRVLSKISNKALRSAVESHLAMSGGNLNDVTAQTRRMGEIANKLLPMIDSVQDEAKSLRDEGLFTPGIGWARRKLSEHGLGTLAGLSGDTVQKMTKFDASIGYLKSAIANAHTGMRGAASPGVAEKFDKLIASTGDYRSFLGDLDAAKELLTMYGASSPGTRHAPADATGGADPAAGFSIERH
jgi:hypothetical protein